MDWTAPPRRERSAAVGTPRLTAAPVDRIALLPAAGVRLAHPGSSSPGTDDGGPSIRAFSVHWAAVLLASRERLEPTATHRARRHCRGRTGVRQRGRLRPSVPADRYLYEVALEPHGGPAALSYERGRTVSTLRRNLNGDSTGTQHGDARRVRARDGAPAWRRQMGQRRGRQAAQPRLSTPATGSRWRGARAMGNPNRGGAGWDPPAPVRSGATRPCRPLPPELSGAASVRFSSDPATTSRSRMCLRTGTVPSAGSAWSRWSVRPSDAHGEDMGSSGLTSSHNRRGR